MMINLLFRIEFMNLLYVHGKTTCRIELAGTMTTLVMFRLLMLHQY